MRSTTSFCSMKCWSATCVDRLRAGGTGSASRCCRAGCRRRAASAPRRGRASAAKSTFSTSASTTSSPGVRRSRAARSRSSSITVSALAALHQRRRSARRRPGPISTSASPGRGSIARDDRVDDRRRRRGSAGRSACCAVRRHGPARLAATAAARATRRRRGRAGRAPLDVGLLELLLAQHVARLLALLLGVERRPGAARRTWIRCTPKRETTGSEMPPSGSAVHRLLELGHERCRARPSRGRRPARRWPSSEFSRASCSKLRAAGDDLRA